MSDPKPITNEQDYIFREKAVTLAITYLNNRQIPDLSKSIDTFETLYKNIYHFITNKPYQK